MSTDWRGSPVRNPMNRQTPPDRQALRAALAAAQRTVWRGNIGRLFAYACGIIAAPFVGLIAGFVASGYVVLRADTCYRGINCDQQRLDAPGLSSTVAMWVFVGVTLMCCYGVLGFAWDQRHDWLTRAKQAARIAEAQARLDEDIAKRGSDSELEYRVAETAAYEIEAKARKARDRAMWAQAKAARLAGQAARDGHMRRTKEEAK